MHIQLFILESIGTQELILVGLVALIIFGPRKLPSMARKFGKMMTELRKVSNDFKATWEKEASMIEDSFKLEDEKIVSPRPEPETVPYLKGVSEESDDSLPSIREVSADEFEGAKALESSEPSPENTEPAVKKEDPLTEKQDWL